MANINKFKHYMLTHNIDDMNDKYSMIVLFLILNGHNKNENDFYTFGNQINLIIEMYQQDNGERLKFCLNVNTNQIDIFDGDDLIAHIFYDKFLNHYFDVLEMG